MEAIVTSPSPPQRLIGDRTAHKAVGIWLMICCALLFAMVVVGGATRLTHSGLSIVEWQPIIGTLPPLGDQDWNELFDKYRQTPQYKKVNSGMTLAEFKNIFWWEYAHRLLGRAIGLVFLVPLAYFALRRQLSRALVLRLAAIFLLGGIQGALGWYMVQSGLVDDPRVSQYRLTAHLTLAFAIYGAILWTALDLLLARRQPPSPIPGWLRRASFALTALICAQIVAGGFVAGIGAGFAYNTFPLMNGHWVPPEIFNLEPRYLNFFNNVATVQFDHRLLASLVAAAVPMFWWMSLRMPLSADARFACNLILAATVLQIGLGIAALLLSVPVALGAAHQAGALLLFSATLLVNHRLR